MRSLNITARMMSVHGELIKAWLNGESIQIGRASPFGGIEWVDARCPQFAPNSIYRIAPKITIKYIRVSPVDRHWGLHAVDGCWSELDGAKGTPGQIIELSIDHSTNKVISCRLHSESE